MSLRYSLIPDYAPSYPLLLAREISALDVVIVSDPIPFPFLLDTVTWWQGPTTSSGFHANLYISDDADTTLTPTPTGDPVFARDFGKFPGEPIEPTWFAHEAVTVEPGLLVLKPAKRIKAFFPSAATGDHYRVLCQLIPLGDLL